MKRSVVAVMAIFIAACSERVMPPVQTALLSNDLTFYRFDGAAFEHTPRTASFYAVKGQQRALVLRYSDTNAEFLRFEVGAQALSAKPDGTEFQAGDSVLISVDVDAAGAMIFRFSPSGLKFDGSSPAKLTLNFARSNPDIDGNGVVGLGDALLGLRAGIWKQELPLLPWFKIPTLNLNGDLARADIHDFTGFGMAVN